MDDGLENSPLDPNAEYKMRIVQSERKLLLDQMDDDINGLSEEIKSSKSRSSTLYSKQSDDQSKDVTVLEDFEIIRIIGSGAYGKVSKFENNIDFQVYLVRHKVDQRVFAMKSIRKDVLVEQKKIQQAYIEKEVMNTVSYLHRLRFIKLVIPPVHHIS